MANLESAIDCAFWDQSISTPLTLEGSAKSVPGEPFPLDGARASKALRIQQLSLLRNGFPLGIIPSLCPPSRKDLGSFSLHSLLLRPSTPNWWLGVIGQFRPKKLISAIRTELQSADELELPVFRDAAKHFLDKSLYSIALATQLSLSPSTSLLWSTERQGEKKGYRNKFKIYHQLPDHDITLDAAWPELFMDHKGIYWEVPESISLDMSSLPSDSGFLYRFGLHKNSGRPQAFSELEGDVPPALMPGLCAKVAFSYQKSKDIWRRKETKEDLIVKTDKGSFWRPSYDMRLKEPHAAISGIIGGTCAAWFGKYSANVESQGDDILPTSNNKRSPLNVDLFGSACYTFQHGQFRKLYGDLTRFDARLDIFSLSSFAKRVSRVSSSADKSLLSPRLNLIFQQQVAGPVVFRVDSKFLLDYKAGERDPHIEDVTYSLSYSLRLLRSGKVVACLIDYLFIVPFSLSSHVFSKFSHGLPAGFAARLPKGKRRSACLLKYATWAFLSRHGFTGIGHFCVWKLFRDMISEGPCPSNYTFNTMILGFCRKGHLGTAESLLNVMQKYKCNPDACSYNILINANCISGLTLNALTWAQLMIERSCKPNIFTFNIIVNALCSEGNVVEARKIVNEIQEIGLSPNAAIYNTLMNGYVKSRDVGQANMLYEEMKSKGINPDAITFNILVAGHFKYGQKEDGDRLLRELLAMNLLPNHSLCDVSVAGLCWGGRLDEAMEFLENMLERGMKPSIVAFNSIIAAYSRAGLEEDAYKVFEFMMNFSLTPSSSRCSSLLLGLFRKGRLPEAREILYKMMMHKGFTINKVAFTVLLDGYFRKGDLAGAQDIWNEMLHRGISPDAVAFSAFINGLSKAGRIEEAYDLFLDMSNKGLMPNNFVYNSLIGGFCNQGRINEALKLGREMRRKGLVPDIFTFNIIINGFCKHARMKSAFDAFMDIHQAGLVPDIVTYNTLISGYCEAFDMVKVDQIMNSMYASGREPGITTYNIQIHGFCSSRKMNKAVMILDELL
ncbi:hypothetical protein V6N11_041863 [Hibiscus sabdariffa]|uniref:Pentatricopeptide repeat-containing protein n=1 Tax=Hibiscus sabdariffa TaxID=183260 RepID=A0ABR2RLN3_9ROSI